MSKKSILKLVGACPEGASCGKKRTAPFGELRAGRNGCATKEESMDAGAGVAHVVGLVAVLGQRLSL